MNHHHLTWIRIIFIAPLICGCGDVLTSEVLENDHHLEHHVPDHKPVSIQAAWKVTQERLIALRPDSTHTDFTQLKDVLTWLPELAGDSDLKRPAWEQIQRFSNQTLLHATTVDNLLTHRQTVLAELETLRALLQDAGNGPRFDLRHSHFSDDSNSHSQEHSHD